MILKNQTIKIFVSVFTERDRQNEKMSQALQISMNSQLRACSTSYEKERMIS